jgi:hypothetical protein
VIDLTFIKGKITYDDLSSLENTDIYNQIDSLKEDLLQVEYPETYLLDVGWYPSFDINGSFHISAIKDYDWGAPLFFSTAKSVHALMMEITAAQSCIRNSAMEN